MYIGISIVIKTILVSNSFSGGHLNLEREQITTDNNRRTFEIRKEILCPSQFKR